MNPVFDNFGLHSTNLEVFPLGTLGIFYICERIVLNSEKKYDIFFIIHMKNCKQVYLERVDTSECRSNKALSAVRIVMSECHCGEITVLRTNGRYVIRP